MQPPSSHIDRWSDARPSRATTTADKIAPRLLTRLTAFGWAFLSLFLSVGLLAFPAPRAEALPPPPCDLLGHLPGAAPAPVRSSDCERTSDCSV